MWYVGTSSLRRLSKKESEFLAEVGGSLASLGWLARLGGRGVVDDVLFRKSEQMGVTKQVILPVPVYRGYSEYKNKEDVVSYTSLSDSVKFDAKKALSHAICKTRIVSPLQENLINSTAPLLLGKDMVTPARFVLTWQDGESDEMIKDGLHVCSSPLLRIQEAPLFRLATQYQIPVFNIANPNHKRRISDFLDLHRAQSATG